MKDFPINQPIWHLIVKWCFQTWPTCHCKPLVGIASIGLFYPDVFCWGLLDGWFLMTSSIPDILVFVDSFGPDFLDLGEILSLPNFLNLEDFLHTWTSAPHRPNGCPCQNLALLLFSNCCWVCNHGYAWIAFMIFSTRRLQIGQFGEVFQFFLAQG